MSIRPPWATRGVPRITDSAYGTVHIAYNERTISNGGDGRRNGDAGQKRVRIKRSFTNGGDGRRNGDAGQKTFCERTLPNGSDGVCSAIVLNCVRNYKTPANVVYSFDRDCALGFVNHSKSQIPNFKCVRHCRKSQAEACQPAEQMTFDARCGSLPIEPCNRKKMLHTVRF